MAKKSTAARQSNAARRPQTTAKATGATLVRQPHESASGSAGTDTAVRSTAEQHVVAPEKPRVTASSTAARPRPLEAPKATATPKAAAPKQEVTQSRPRPASDQAARVARARATQRARTANMITPEHYSYVINDLKLIASLAAAMFMVIIVLHFVLG